MKLDQTDKKIIQLLGADARMSNNQMAKVIGVTEGTVRNRIQKLIQNKVIKISVINNINRMENPSLAFVKCTVDEEFYMPPPMTIVPTKVFARDFKVVVPVPKLEIIKVPLDDDPDTPEDESKCLVPTGVVRKVIPVFSPHTPEGDNTTVNTIDYSRRSAVDGKAVYKQTIAADATFGRFDGEIARIDRENVLLVNSLKTQQASDHVYALVTLPGKSHEISYECFRTELLFIIIVFVAKPKDHTQNARQICSHLSCGTATP